MAKKKNVVQHAKGMASMILVLIIGAGWILSVYTIVLDDDSKKQEALIHTAQIYLEDKLYIRAVGQYQMALDTYHTENNLAYETQLLGIYKEAGMMEDYYDLIDSRMEAGTASLQEYEERARNHLEEGTAKNAMAVLQQGISAYQDVGLISLYESICYEYVPSSTAYTEVKMPSANWLIPAYDGERWGYIGGNGRTVLDFRYEDATCFSGNYAVVKIDGVYTLIDKNGYWNAVDKNGLDAVTAISGKRIIGVKDGRYGIYTNTFMAVGNETFDNACLSDNGLIAVQKDGKWAILDADMKVVTDYRFTDIAVNSKGQLFSGNYAVVADESGYYLIDQKGEACFETRFAGAKGMEEGLFAVRDDLEQWGFANEKAEIVVPFRYEDAYSFSNRLAAVKYAGEWGYINRYDTMVIKHQFASAFPFLGGSALVTDERGNYRVITLKYYELL